MATGLSLDYTGGPASLKGLLLCDEVPANGTHTLGSLAIWRLHKTMGSHGGAPGRVQKKIIRQGELA